ncbi:MAG: DegQ family serine endoprotease [Gammaproteobacteria bacterium]|nr:DegQ family serine endoprotease [Gammaproteobacteria bacterium]
MKRSLDVAGVWFLLVVWAVPVWSAIPVEMNGERLPSLAPMLEQTTPGIVNIATYTTVRVRNPLLDDPFFRRFFNVPEGRGSYRRTRSAGSGVIVDADDGYIITNNHVIDRADEIAVTLADGRTLQAELVGVDPKVDLAVLKVDGDQLTELAFGDSSQLRVGDFVVAIGNPFGLEQTVTSGIVSALGRSGLGIEGYEDFIQTDASINPGNSGGALVDLAGNLVGINTAIIAPSGGNVGIGFAIPSNLVEAIMTQLIEHGEVRRRRIGVYVQTLNSELAEAFGVEAREGVVVVDVEPGSIADVAGIQPGDIVTRVGDREVKKVADFSSQAAITMVGDTVDVRVIRGGKRKRFSLTIEDNLNVVVDGGRLDNRLAGSELSDFRGDLEDDSAGVLVSAVEAGSNAWRYGLREGDVIVAANRRATRNIGDLSEMVRYTTSVRLRVYRAGRYGDLWLR